MGQRRTVLIWVIFILSIIGMAIQVASIYLVFSGTLPLPREMVETFAIVPTEEILAGLATSMIGLAGAIALFMLRRVAVVLFVVAFAMQAAHHVWQFYYYGWTNMVSDGGLFSLMIVVTISLLIVLYSWSLDRRGYLA